MTTTESAPLLSLRGVGRRYNRTGAWALTRIDLDIYRGDFIAITGPSGAGKSTLLNVLALLDSYDVGEYQLDGQDIRALPRRKRDTLRGETFGFVFQHSNAIDNRTVIKNVEVPLVSTAAPFEERATRIGEALTQANIIHKGSQRVSLLSGGERQRMAIARALTTKPAVLFLDEPTGNLDSANSAAIMDLLDELNASGTTIVLVTHDAALAARARRQITVNDGVIAEISADATRPAVTGHETRARGDDHRRWWRRTVDAVCEAAWSLWDNRTRSAIEILTTAVAICGLAASVSLGLTASNQVDQLISAASQNMVTVATQQPTGTAEAFSDDALQRVARLDGIVAAGRHDRVAASDADISRFGANVPGDTASVELVGATAGTFQALRISSPPIVAGLFESKGPGQNIAVVGAAAARSLHVGSGPGQTIFVGNHAFDVLAITSSASVANSVVVPHAAIVSLRLPAKQTLVARTAPGRSAVVSDAVPLALDPGNPGAFTVTGAANLGQLRGDVSSSFQWLLLLLSSVLLAAAIIATSAIMSSAVIQRRAEIGLRMATGASPSSVGSLFVVEGGVLGAVGSVLGVFLAVGTVLLVSMARGWTPYFDFVSLVGALVIGVVAGLLASIIPSVRASRIQPAIAVRG
ncbi:ATP-binding cassette domain-containing protein [Leifsonia shinshuensis]|uniref:Macrolide transport system ATP-binding/permease protein n=1 Tax=Leifsonia shinshuensis TaxID=150026 RepID=A0A853D0Y3_9MICO|nr:ABC transporter ATP-binding protein/permease [Leifsonia shinshuensis]NYJ25783.1 macrolide transport system ATP-binding/permease protein [Leifsonia shinshuensis]